MVVVTKRELENLGRTYGYHCTDKSITGPLMQHYWTWAVQFVPMRWHPNVVTYTGFIWLLTSVAIIFYFDYNSDFDKSTSPSTEAPNYVWFWAAISIFMYQTFDALDGKQARRIKAGSPAGEIVDHSADAVTTIFVQYLLCSAIFRNSPLRGFALTLWIFMGFFAAHWEHYVTRIFYLGYVSGPTEGLLLTTGLFLLTGTFGPTVWSDPSYYYFPKVNFEITTPYLTSVLHPTRTTITMNKNADFVFYFTFISGMLTVVPSVVKTIRHVAKMYLKRERGSPVSPTLLSPPVSAYEAIARTAIPYFILCMISCDYVLQFRRFHSHHFFFMEVALGWVTALAATRVTVRRLTGAKYGFATVSYVATFLGLVLPLIALRSDALFGGSGNKSLIASLLTAYEVQWFKEDVNMKRIWILIGVVGGAEYVFYCWRLLVLMAKHLGINLLVLTPGQLDYVKQLEKEKKNGHRIA